MEGPRADLLGRGQEGGIPMGDSVYNSRLLVGTSCDAGNVLGLAISCHSGYILEALQLVPFGTPRAFSISAPRFYRHVSTGVQSTTRDTTFAPV